MTEKVTQQAKKLNPNQVRGIAALLTEPTITAAAEKAGVQPKTIYRWLKQPEFTAALSEAQAREIETASRRLAGMQSDALDALADVFARSDRLAALNVADFFIEDTYTDPETGRETTRLILDLEKIKERGQLVKKLKTSKGELEIESYDALAALGMKQRAAEAILNYMMRLREFADLESRISALEERIK